MSQVSKVLMALFVGIAGSLILCAGTDVGIGDAGKIEANVFAALNPGNSNNAVLTFMRSESATQTTFPIYFSHNFGQTWTEAAFRPLPPDEGILRAAADPQLVFDADGMLYMLWFYAYSLPSQPLLPATGIFWAFSSDGGQNWQQEENAVAIASANAFTELYDEQWPAVDRSDSPKRGTLYLAASHRSEGLNGEASRVVLLRKAVAAKAFESTVVEVSDERFSVARLPSVAVDRAGKVHVTFVATEDEAADHWSLWHRVSEDGGLSFREARKVSNIHLPTWSAGTEQDNVTGVVVHPSAYIQADHSTGRLYLAWCADGVNQAEENGLDIYFSFSADDGTHWSTPLIVNDDPAGLGRHQFHPNAAIDEAGNISLCWYDGRAAAGNAAVHFYYCHSSDGGLAFSANKALSSAATDFATVGLNNSGYGVGRYAGLVAAEGKALAAWTDGRDGSAILNIFSAETSLKTTASGMAPTVDRSAIFQLDDAAPNPCRSQSKLGFRLTRSTWVRLSLSNVVGNHVATLTEKFYPPGSYSFLAATAGLAPGLYTYTLATNFGAASAAFVVLP